MENKTKSGRYLGQLFFAPGQHKHHVELRIARDVEELRKAWNSQCECAPEFDENTAAFCAFPPEIKDHRFGVVWLSEPNPLLSALVHECTHAAVNFIGRMVMKSEAVRAMSDDARAEYFDEACAHTVQALFNQGFGLLAKAGLL